MMQTTGDTPGQSTNHRLIPQTGVSTVLALTTAPGETTGNHYDTVQSLQSPYFDTPPSNFGKVDFSDLTQDVTIIAVIGLTQSGKSTFIKVATGSDEVQIGDSMNSFTQARRVVHCRNPFRNASVSLVDSPGFDDTFRTDAEILRGIADWLEKTYHRSTKLSGILYLHRITDNRVPHNLLRNLELLRRLCGDDVLSKIRFVTTNWDLLAEKSEGERKEEELRSEYWSHFIEGGSQMYRFQNTHPSAWEIINSLPMEGKAILIQQEMVDQHIPLPETSAGKPLFAWASKGIREMIARLGSLIRTFISSTTSQDKSRDEASKKRLKEARDELHRIESTQSPPSRVAGVRSRSSSFSSSKIDSYRSGTSHSPLSSRIRQTFGGRFSFRRGHRRDSHPTPLTTDSEAAKGSNIIIAVVGQTGAGKSTFINVAAGKDILPVNHGLKPAKSDGRLVRCSMPARHGNRHVVFVDMPAFDSERDEHEVETRLKKRLEKLFSKKAKLSGILYLHDITDPKLTDLPASRLALLKFLCEVSGGRFPSRVMMVTTMWRHMQSPLVGRAREAELQRLWDKLPEGTAHPKVQRFEDTIESAWSIVLALLGGSDSLGPTVPRTGDRDMPNSDTDSLFEAATGADPVTTGTLTSAIQTLRFARATVTDLPIPGLVAALESALRVAELLNGEIHDTDRSLVALIDTVSRFIKTICSQDQPLKAYPQPVIDAIGQFIVQLQRVENVAWRVRKKGLRRNLLEPEDRRIISDCNDAIKLMLHALGIRIGLATAAQNEDILRRLNELQGLVTRMLNAAHENYELKRRRSI